MGKPILYGTEISPPVRSVLLTVKAIGLDIEFREVNMMKFENMSGEFLKKNPQHTIPVLEDDGKFIWDSHAIATYLIGKYAADDSLYPEDLYERALIDQRLHFDSGILFVRMRSIGEQLFFKGDPDISQEKIDSFYSAYDFLETFLANSDYLAGDSVTVADFCCISSVSSMQGFAPIDADKYPNVSRWILKMTELPYYEEANGRGAVGLIDFFKQKINELKGEN